MSVPEADPAPAVRRRRRSHAERIRERRVRRIAVVVGGISAATLVFLAAAFWSSRNQAPSGQVVAVVNGGEVTLQDLQAEARARGLPFEDVPMASLLAPVVDRTLLAQEAKTLRLDRKSTFPVDHHRGKQLLLARQLTDQLIGAPIAPSDKEVADVIASEPFLFARRQRLRLRQIRFEADDTLMAQIGDTPTAAALETRLKQLSIPTREDIVMVDSADLDSKLAEAILALPPDGLLTARQGSSVVADALLGSEPMSLSSEDRQAAARRLIEQRRSAEIVNETVAKLRQKAKIQYQRGADAP